MIQLFLVFIISLVYSHFMVKLYENSTEQEKVKFANTLIYFVILVSVLLSVFSLIVFLF